MAAAEFSRFVGILSAALSQHHLWIIVGSNQHVLYLRCPRCVHLCKLYLNGQDYLACMHSVGNAIGDYSIEKKWNIIHSIFIKDILCAITEMDDRKHC